MTPRHRLEFLAPCRETVGELPNVLRLCLSSVDAGDVFLFRGWVHV